jgi:hypothetical protein
MPDLDAILAHDRHLIVADFASEYGIRLHQVGNALSWVEFHDLLWALLAAPTTRVWRRYAPKRQSSQPTDDAEGGDDE